MLSPGLHSRSLLFGFLDATNEGWLGTAWSFTWLVCRGRPREIVAHAVRVSHVVSFIKEELEVWTIRPTCVGEPSTHNSVKSFLIINTINFVGEQRIRLSRPDERWVRLVEDEVAVAELAQGVDGQEVIW